MLSIQLVKITVARFDSFLKSSVILENIDTIIYKFQLCIYVGHFLKVFIQLYGIFFLLLSEVIYHLLCMCSNSSKWVTKRDREIKIYIFEHCVGGGGDFLLWLGDLLVAGIKDKAAKYTGSPLSSLFFTHSAKKILLHFNLAHLKVDFANKKVSCFVSSLTLTTRELSFCEVGPIVPY